METTPADSTAPSPRGQLFGRAVDVYDATRPDYPKDAVTWALGAPEAPLAVAEFGAGTGKLTIPLVALGHTVIAIDPDPAMLERLRTHCVPQLDSGQLQIRSGTAEDPPLADGEVDAVLAGQAWHWFDQARVATQLARVVRQGGLVAALFNTRDASVDWVDQWHHIVHDDDHPTGSALLLAAGGPAFGDAFTEPEYAAFRHGWSMAPGELVDLTASRSHTITLPRNQYEGMLNEVADFATTHPALLGHDEVVLLLDTEVFRAHHRCP